MLKFTTALIVRVPASAASGYGKNIFLLLLGFGSGSLEHNFEGSGLVRVHQNETVHSGLRFGSTPC